MEKIVRHLRREAIANPKKAAVLGLLLLVAVWFWVPLLWGWLKADETAKGKETASKAVSTISTQRVSESSEPSGSVPVEAKKDRWKDVATWIESDPRMTVAADSPHRQHPFEPVKPPPPAAGVTTDEESKQAAHAEAVSPVSLAPEDLGMTLSSTIVGPDRRAALINGRSYPLGGTVQVDARGQSIEFKIVEIQDDRVVLQRGEQKDEIRLPEKKPSGRLEVKALRAD